MEHGPTGLEVQEVLYGFTQRCFVGAVPGAEATSKDRDWLVGRLRIGDKLEPHEVATWPLAKQRALYEALRDMIALLTMHPPFRFPPGQLDGSSAAAIGGPLLAGVAESIGASAWKEPGQ